MSKREHIRCQAGKIKVGGKGDQPRCDRPATQVTWDRSGGAAVALFLCDTHTYSRARVHRFYPEDVLPEDLPEALFAQLDRATRRELQMAQQQVTATREKLDQARARVEQAERLSARMDAAAVARVVDGEGGSL